MGQHVAHVQACLALLLCLSFSASHVGAIQSKCSACRAVAAELQQRMDEEKPRNHLDLRHRLDSEGKRYGKSIDYKRSELRTVELLDELCKEMKDYSYVPVDCGVTDGLCKPVTIATLTTGGGIVADADEAPAANDDAAASGDGDAASAAAAAEAPDAAVEAPAEAAAPSAEAPAAGVPEVKQATRRMTQWLKTSGKNSTPVQHSIRTGKEEEGGRAKELEYHCGRLLEDYEDDVAAALMRGDLEVSGAAEAHLCQQLSKACPASAAAPAAVEHTEL